MLTLQEAADRLGLHYMTVYRWVRTGKLPASKHGGSWVVDPADLEAAAGGPDGPAEEQPASGRRADHVTRLARRLVAGDEAGAMAVAEAALAGGMDPEDLYLDVLAGAMARIGDQWATGTVSVAEEHQATVVLHRLLGRLGRSFTRRGRSRGTVVLGAAAGDHHGLAGAILADPLRGRRFSVVDLGADTPAAAFVETALRFDDLVAVGITLAAPPVDGLRSTIDGLRDAGVTAPILAGGGAVPDRATATEFGADLWAPSGREALELLDGIDARA